MTKFASSKSVMSTPHPKQGWVWGACTTLTGTIGNFEQKSTLIMVHRIATVMGGGGGG